MNILFSFFVAIVLVGCSKNSTDYFQSENAFSESSISPVNRAKEVADLLVKDDDNKLCETISCPAPPNGCEYEKIEINELGCSISCGELACNNSEEKEDEVNFQVVHSNSGEVDCQNIEGSKEYDVELGFAIDDIGTAYIDGKKVGENFGWNQFQTVKLKLKAGCHILALNGKDVNSSVAGLIAYLKIKDKVVWNSGDGNEYLKVHGPQAPAAGWMNFSFDDRDWQAVKVCNASSLVPWGKYYQKYYDQGATWVWWTDKCNSLAQAYFRMAFTIDEK